jgi:Large polyvalent protein associated domain 38
MAAPQFDTAAARADGVPDSAIAAYLAPMHGFDLDAARKDGVSDTAIVDFLAPPQVPAPPAPPPSSTVGGMAKAAAQLPTQIGGGLVKAGGAMTAAAGTVVAEAPRNIEAFERRQIDIMDKIDRGEKVAPMDDPLGYQDASPEQRAQLRKDMVEGMAAAPPPEKTDIGQAGQALKEAGGAVMGAGERVVAYGEAAHPLTDEEKQRFSVKSVQMVGNLVPYLGAAAVGGLPAVVGLAGVQGFGDHYDAAKKAGSSDEDAATAGLLGGLANAGLMTVPVGRAMEIATTLRGAARGEFLRSIVEMTKGGATLTAFSQLQTLADNAIAKTTYAPDRDLTEGLGRDIGPQFVAGMILPAVAAVGHLAPRATPRDILQAGTVDDAIKAARDVVAQPGTPVDVEAHATDLEAGDHIDQQQAKLLRLFDGLGRGPVEQAPDGGYHLRTTDAAGKQITIPIEVWNPDEAEEGEGTIAPQTAQRIRDFYAGAGIDTVFYQDDPRLPFDGSADPKEPDTIFLSNNPQRNIAQVAGHEIAHAFVDTKIPDGPYTFGDILNQQIAAGLTPEGQRHAETQFGQNAPKRTAFPEGEQGDALHAAAVQNFLVNELASDIGGEAPKFQTFLPKVVNAIQARYGNTVAGDMLAKLIEGMRNAIETIRSLFTDSPTLSQNWVTNLGDIHDTLAKMYAERFGAPVERESARLDAMRDQAARDRFTGEGGPEAPDATQEAPPTPEPPVGGGVLPSEDAAARLALWFKTNVPDARTQDMLRQVEARVNAPGSETPVTGAPAARTPMDDYQDAQRRALVLRRWLGELDDERRQQAANSPQGTYLRQTEATILGKVRGVESRLTQAARIRLDDVRMQLRDLTNPQGDSPGMARVREALGVTTRQLDQLRAAVATAEAPAAPAALMLRQGPAEAREAPKIAAPNAAQADRLKPPEPAERGTAPKFGPKPWDINKFLASRGGLVETPSFRGELTSRDLHKAFIPGQGKLVRRNGMDLDTAREAATEAGYLPEDASTDDLMNAIERTFRGQPVYRGVDADLEAERLDWRNQIDEGRSELRRMGYDDTTVRDADVHQVIAQIHATNDMAREVDEDEALRRYYGGDRDIARLLKEAEDERARAEEVPFDDRGARDSEVAGGGAGSEAAARLQGEGAEPRGPGEGRAEPVRQEPDRGLNPEDDFRLDERGPLFSSREAGDVLGPIEPNRDTDLLPWFRRFLEVNGDRARTALGLNDLARAYVIHRGVNAQVETAVAFDRRVGEISHAVTSNAPSTVSADVFPKEWGLGRERYVVHHNHPSNTALSGSDLRAMVSYPGIEYLLAHGHPRDGESALTAARLTPAMRELLAAHLDRQEEIASQLHSMIKEVDRHLADTMRPLIYAGRLSVAVANATHQDFVDRAMHRAGLIDYISSIDSEDRIGRDVLMQIGAALDASTNEAKATRSYLKDIPDELHRPAPTVRPEVAMARVLGPAAQAAEGRPGRPGGDQARGVDAGQGSTARVDAAGQYRLDIPAGETGVARPAKVTGGQGSLFSPRITGAEKETEHYTPEQIEAYKRVGRITDEPTFRERLAALRQNFWTKAIQQGLDPYIPLKSLDPMVYVTARNANTSSGAMEVLMKHGKLSLVGNAYDGDMSGGFEHVVERPLQGEMHRFLWWVAANRAERLAAEDRENLFSPEDIRVLKGTNQGRLPFEYELSNGKTTTSREAAYLDSLKKFDAFNRNVNDIAEQSGLIKGASRAAWEKMFYVPFYRVSEGDGKFAGPNITSGFVKQSAFKTLKGGAEKLNADLLDNVLRNWSHLIDASARNRAANAALDVARQGPDPIAVERTQAEVDHMMTKAEKRDLVWTMRNGEKTYFQVKDPMMFQAITALDFTGFHNPFMNAMTWFKNKLTSGVTMSPVFKVRLLIRDSMQAIATAPLSYNMFRNVAEGMKANDLGGAMANMARAAVGRDLADLNVTQDYVSSLAGGGLVRFGSGREPAGQTSKLIERNVKGASPDPLILDTTEKIKAFWGKVGTFAEAWRELGSQAEDANRIALYRQLRARGAGHEEAVFAARDLEDFSLKGAAPAVRFLTQVVPFMNAWAQGLYKLGRATAEDTRRVGIVLGATALISIGLNALYKDDEDWKKRDEYDRNTNWWFKIGNTAFRIPKGFEIGAIATIAERGLEMFYNPEMNGRRFMNNVWDILGTNLSMNPVPQMFKPIIDLAQNANSATGNPIEPMGLENLRPEDRYRSGTTLIAREASSIGASVMRAMFGPQAQVLSPIQIDYLTQGYFGWLGAFVTNMADHAIRQVTDEPARPSPDWLRLATGGIASDVRDQASYYVDLMYQQATAVNQAYGSYHDMMVRGRYEDAQQFLEENRALIQRHGLIGGATRLEGEINQQIRRVENSQALTPDQKRVEIMRLNAVKNRSAESIFGAR